MVYYFFFWKVTQVNVAVPIYINKSKFWYFMQFILVVSGIICILWLLPRIKLLHNTLKVSFCICYFSTDPAYATICNKWIIPTTSLSRNIHYKQVFLTWLFIPKFSVLQVFNLNLSKCLIFCVKFNFSCQEL